MKSAEVHPGRPEAVVLLHGMGRSALSMKRIEWTLARHGYAVTNLSYPSTRFAVEDVVRRHLTPVLDSLQSVSPARVHFVTHSLGGILLRALLAERAIHGLGRIVMLGPPNRGSEIADALKPWRIYRWLTGPSGQQLGTGRMDLPQTLAEPDCEVGIIAGDRSLNPVLSRLLPRPHDGKVSVASTRLKGMSDFLVMPHTHTWLPWRRPVIRQIVAFLKTGRFERR
jgi:hypothetical protein